MKIGRKLIVSLGSICLLAMSAGPIKADVPAVEPKEAGAATKIDWVSDYTAAKKTAAAQGKDLLLDFTGSDWCGWCIKLHEEVFDKEEFLPATKDFVFVELDYPNQKVLPESTKKQNEELKTQFAIEGYPTIFLTDSTGKPYAKTGYQEGGPKAYLKHLAELSAVKTKRDAAWKSAEGKEGVARAKLLADGLNAMDADLVTQHYSSVIKEIAQLDPRDETGVAANFGFRSELAAVLTKLQAKDPAPSGADARKEIDAFITAHPTATAERKQEALLGILNFCRPPKDNDFVMKLMTDIIALDGNTEIAKVAQKVQEQVKSMK